MKVSINPNMIGKPNESTPKSFWVEGFEHRDITRCELAEIINAGQALAPQYNGKRSKRNFKCSGFLAIDMDKGMTLAEALVDPYIQAHACLIYTTVNHRKNGNGDRFRIVFELPEAIDDREVYERALKALLKRFPMADNSQNHAASLFCGSPGSNPTVLEGGLSYKDFAELIMIHSQPEQKRIEKEFQKYKEKLIPLDEARRMLTFIPARQEYERWRNVCWGLLSYYGENAIELINDWSPDYRTGGTMVEQLYRDNRGFITIGTVIHYAQERGYQLPLAYQSKAGDKPALLAFKHLFNDGKGYCSINGALYRYEDGIYQKLEKAPLQKQILRYFQNHHPKYADMRSVNDALNCVTALCHVDASQVNPSGLNCSNGFLQLTYDELTGQVLHQLIEHSPEIICTYKSKAVYNPEADSTVLDNALNDMLEADHQSILLRNLAASLALPIVRKYFVRVVRLLILVGEGSNGKDTLREWLYYLYGGQGVTSVSLQAFRDADRGRAFGLSPLATSRVNWSSENINLLLSECQTLKAFATGDPFWAEEKNVQGREIRPQAVALFNVNDLPKFDTQKEAILSRYGFVPFSYTFKQDPNPNNPREKQGDPRLKEDTGYIIDNILPALLNRLLDELNNLLAEGIDYSATQQVFQDILESSSHLAVFIRESGLEECSLDQGLLASQIFDIYETWCRMNDLITQDFMGRTLHNDPAQSDKVIRHANKLRSPIMKYFPRLQHQQISMGSRYNLRFNREKAEQEFIDSLEPRLRAIVYGIAAVWA